jgi:hypothetical protein
MRRIAKRILVSMPGVNMGGVVEHMGIRLQEAQRSPAMLGMMPFEHMLLASGQTQCAINDHPAYGEGSAGRMCAVDRNLAARSGLDRNSPDWSATGQPPARGRAARGSRAAQIEREVNYIKAAIEAQNLHFVDRADALRKIREMIYRFFGMNPGGPVALPGSSEGDGP